MTNKLQKKKKNFHLNFFIVQQLKSSKTYALFGKKCSANTAKYLKSVNFCSCIERTFTMTFIKNDILCEVSYWNTKQEPLTEYTNRKE